MTKKRRCLRQKEAEYLGLKPKADDKGRSSARYPVTDDQYNRAMEFRNSGIIEAHKEHNVDYKNSKFLWLKNKNSSIPVQNPFYKPRVEKQFENFKDKLVDDLKSYSPNFKTLKRKANKDGYLLVIDLADLHVGKLADSFETGKDYNSQIAVQRAKQGVIGLLNKSSGVYIDKILFIGGNDILHTDTPNKTTKGTEQDADGMWYRNFIMARDLYIELLEILISVADVHFVFNPSNHDYQSGFYLAQLIETYFRKSKNITFACDLSDRKYFRYYNNAIGTTHGHNAKDGNLALLMATEFKYYSECKRRYIYTHHLHKKDYGDHPGITIERIRSLSDADSWHHRQGFQHAPIAIEAFLHHKEYGQEIRLTHNF